MTSSLSRAHLRRLKQYYRSAGWPCHDTLELELLVAGLVERVANVAAGTGASEVIRVTSQGAIALADYAASNRRALEGHDALVERVAHELIEAGRVVFRGVSLKARVAESWRSVRPDVYSLRHATREEELAPIVHEIKVERSDLRVDLKNAAKRQAYQALSAEFYYVLAEGIAEPEEIPEDCGVMIARRAGGLERLRRSPSRSGVRIGVHQWLTLAKARAEYGAGSLPLDLAESRQLPLVEIAGPDS